MLESEAKSDRPSNALYLENHIKTSKRIGQAVVVFVISLQVLMGADALETSTLLLVYANLNQRTVLRCTGNTRRPT